MNTINCEIITSRKNPKILLAASLADKKNRDLHGLFAVDGIKLLRELVLCGVCLDSIFFTRQALEKYSRDLEALNFDLPHLCEVKLFEVTHEVYDKISEEKSPEGIFAVAKKPVLCDNSLTTPGDGGFLILDRIQNPSNVGAMLRTACGLGFSKVILGEGCADVFGKKALRASMGTAFKLNLCVIHDLCSELEKLKANGYRIFSTALDDDSVDIRSVSFEHNDCVVLGSEGTGISSEVLKRCDKKLIIPMWHGTESLNAANAAAILMWEMKKGDMK